MVAQSGALAYMLGLAPPTVADIEMIERIYLQMIKTEGPISIINVIRPRKGAGRVSAEARARILKRIEAIEEACLGEATVVEGRGVLGTIVRTFLAGLAIVSKSKRPTKVFSTVQDAMAWLKSMPAQKPAFFKSCHDLETFILDAARAA